MAKVKRGKSLSVINHSERPEQFVQRILEDSKPQEITKTVQEFQTLAESVAKSSIYIRNWYLDEFRVEYRHFDRVKRFDKFFPFARITDEAATTTLYVDEPANDHEVEVCYRKAKMMADLGLNYVILEKDSTLFDALNQLGVIK
ncbi:hypothetical protein EBT16_04135 [bacterium]|nr:hypothetical protein [bacterium]